MTLRAIYSAGRCSLVTIVGVFLILALAPAAYAGDKAYSVVMSPGTVSAGTTVRMTATLDNEDPHQQLGAADLFPPAGFEVTSASVSEPGSATLSSSCETGSLSGPCVELRNLALGSGDSVSVTLGVRTPAGSPSCHAATTASWSVDAKQANNFSGAGNDMTLDTAKSSLTTTIPCAVGLKFVGEPNAAGVGETITQSQFDPTGPLIEVETVDASGNPVSSSASITIALGAQPGGATLGGTTTEQAINGVADFGSLTVNKVGEYTLLAWSPGLTGAISSDFDVTTTGTVCQQGAPCAISLSTAASTLQVTSPSGTGSNNAGTLSGTVDADHALVCPGYTARDPNWYEVNESTDARAKTITYVLKNTKPAGVHVCFGASYSFEVLNDSEAPPATLPDGSSGYIGLLENCESYPEGPEACVQSIVGVRDASAPCKEDTVATIRIDAGLSGDPWGRM